MKRILLFTVMAALAGQSPGAFAESATVVRATQLNAAPYTDAERKGILRGETRVEILDRNGGWYRVKVEGNGNEGWVRMASLRLGERSAEESESSFWGSLFSFTGRSQSRDTVATTGIRGLSEEEINSATPNPAAVAALDGFAADANTARDFAARLKLQEQRVAELPEDVEKEAAR